MTTASENPRADAQDWPGQWIAYEKERLPRHGAKLKSVSWIWTAAPARFQPHLMTRDDSAVFRKSFDLDDLASLEKADLYLTADGAYTLFLNGKRLASNGYWRRVDRINLAPHLLEGRNLIAVHVDRHLPGEAESAQGSGTPSGLIALLETKRQGSRPNALLSTDSSWKATDQQPADDHWTRKSFSDNDWSRSQVLPIQGLATWRQVDEYSNRWYCYRHAFKLSKRPKQAIARIAVDSKYWLWINGERAVLEGAVKRGPDPRNTYFDAVDLAPYLKRGRNTIAILAWYWGRDGFSHNDSGRHGLYFDLRADATRVLSGPDWKAASHPAFAPSDPPFPNYRLPEFNVRFDARKDIGPWFEPGFDDRSWRNAVALGSPPSAPWGKLADRLIPQWWDSGLVAYPTPPRLPRKSDGQTLALDLGTNAMVTPYFKIKAPAGLKVDLRMDNYRGGGTENIRSEYITKEGIQEFETPAWMNGHSVEYRFPKGVEILDLKYRETAFDAPVTGSFHCDNPQLNELWQRSLRTLQVCMRDTYYDCPDRERAQWWGDAVIEIGQTFYALDRVADTLSRKAILELVNWQRDDKVLFSPVPSGKWRSELPGQMLMSIGYYGFWTYYFYTGDAETIRQAYPAIRPYLELWQLDSDGLIANRQGDWYWGDWGENKDTRILDNGYYHFALDGAARMAKLLGHDQDLPFYEERMRSIRENFDRVFWQGDVYRSPNYQGETDDRGHALAVLAGLADPKNHDAIARFLLHNQHASPYLEKYILEALFVMGRPQQAMDRMLDRYQPHLAEDIATLFEGWGIGEKGFGGGTINHSWSGGPLTLLSQYVAGIAPLAAGFERIAIKPQPGDLQSIQAVVPSIKGPIHASFRRNEKSITQRIRIPEGAVAEFGIPVHDLAQIDFIEINRKRVFSRQRYSPRAPYRCLGQAGPHFLIELPAGEYRIHTRLHD